MTYYTVYKITNRINGKFYIGMHKTSNLDDGYFGSGTLIKRAIDKYGLENFDKEYLSIFDNNAEMVELESVLVDETFINECGNYNLKLGGGGGFDYVNSVKDDTYYKIRSDNALLTTKKVTTRRSNDPIFNKRLKDIRSNATSKRNRDGDFGCAGFNGKSHTEHSKRSIGSANSKHQKGSGNSQYGTCWIYNDEGSKKIPKSELDVWINNGWIKGRRIKNVELPERP